MQNYILSSNNTDNKIPYDLRSEVLFRSAEDCFFYFGKTKAALKKLDKALEYYPNHFKSLMLKGDIMFSEGNYDDSLKLYIKALELRPENPRVSGSVANCLNELKFYTDAKMFCDKAINLSRYKNEDLYSSLCELKIKILMNLKEYDNIKNLMNTRTMNTHENLIVLKKVISKTLSAKMEIQKRLKTTRLRAL